MTNTAVGADEPSGWGRSSTRESVFRTFQALAAKTLEVAAGRVVEDASFTEDLGADSLDVVELSMAVEEEFDIDVNEGELDGIAKVGQVMDVIMAKLSAKV